MSDLPVQLHAFNQQLKILLIEKDVDWVQCLELVERRDALLEAYLDKDERKAVDSESELKSIMEASLDLNKRIASRMKVEQDEAEQALLTLNQGKKARASYE